MTHRNPYRLLLMLFLLSLSGCSSESAPDAVPEAADINSAEIIHGYAENHGVKIHFAETGEGPLVVMIHGFPDFWYTWRHQMDGLKDSYRVVAIDPNYCSILLVHNLNTGISVNAQSFGV